MPVGGNFFITGRVRAAEGEIQPFTDGWIKPQFSRKSSSQKSLKGVFCGPDSWVTFDGFISMPFDGFIWQCSS